MPTKITGLIKESPAWLKFTKYTCKMRKCLLLLLLLLWIARSLATFGRLGIGILQYSRDDLLSLRYLDYSAPNSEKGGELRRHSPNHDRRRATSRRKRGRRGGVRQRLKRLTGTSKCPPIPPIVLANVRSLWNKLDELHANITCQWAYRQANLICLTETWLDNTIADSDALSGRIRNSAQTGPGHCE